VSYFRKYRGDLLILLLLPIFWLSYLIPRDRNIWAFGSNLGNTFASNPKYFYLYVSNNHSDTIKPIWISRKKAIIDSLNKMGLKGYYLFSFKGFYYALRSGVYIFDHHRKDISFLLSGRSIKINLFHGIPLKKISYDNKFDEVRNPSTLFKKIIGSIRRLQNERTDHYYLATSETVAEIFVSAFKSSYSKMIICGYPRNDIFFNDSLNISMYLVANDGNLYTQLEQEKNICGKKIITYMPTHRATEAQILEIIDFNKLDTFLESKNATLLIKAHPYSNIKNFLEKLSYKNIRVLSAAADPYPFLKISDVLITDYSSVYFDFLLKNKSIIFFSYDIEEYKAQSREIYYDYDSVTPGPKVSTMGELIDSIRECLDGVDEFKLDRDRLIGKFYSSTEGNASETLFNKVINIVNN